MTTLSTPSATTRRGRGLTWARVQAGSALVFLVFAALHLVNTALGAVSVEAYNGFQRALRPFYQHPVLELFAVLGPLAVHMFASVVRMRQRRSSRAPRSLHARAHRYAGYFLLTFILGHVAATRLPPWLAGVKLEFEGVAYTFELVPAWFYPYYAALGLAGVVHATFGVPRALGTLGVRVGDTWQRGVGIAVVASLGSVAVLAGVAGLGGLLWSLPDLSAHPAARLANQVASALGWNG